MIRRLLTPLRLAVAIALAVCSSAGLAYAASFGLASSHLYAWSQPLTKGSCAPAESDAEIDASNPNTSFGNQSSETVQSKNGGNSYVLIGVDLAGTLCSLPPTGGADSATLTIVVTGTFKGPDTISAYPITSPWSASTVTWNTMPTYASTPDFSFSGTGTTVRTVTAPIDAGIKSGAFYGWMLVDTTGANNATTTLAGHSSTKPPSIALNFEK